MWTVDNQQSICCSSLMVNDDDILILSIDLAPLSKLQFLGAGERKKAIIGPIAVNVYAIGLYVDSAAAKVCGEIVPF
jgi:hypothetical protein